MAPSRGILGYSAYLPRHRLLREDVGAARGEGTRGVPARAVAGHDEDTTTLGVEAARRALRGMPPLRSVLFATASAAYQEKSSAATVHAALGLPEQLLALDAGGATRSGMASLLTALDGPHSTLAVLSEVQVARPGSAGESELADAAAAFVTGSGPDVIAQLLAHRSRTAELSSRWRLPTEATARTWDERFVAWALAPIMAETAADALAAAGVERAEHVVVTASQQRTAREVMRAFAPESRVRDVGDHVGFAGAAHVGLQLAAALDRAQPGEHVLVVSGADGCDALVLRATDALTARRQQHPVEEQATGGLPVAYASYLHWRGLLDREGPRRPEPQAPAAPAAHRAAPWKFGLRGGRCEHCSTLHLPAQEVCVQCREAGTMLPEPVAERRAKIVTFAVDHLTPSPVTPSVAAVLDFEGGGRALLELTEVQAQHLAVGAEVEMVFRRLSTAGGTHNYFWKGRPVAAGG